MWQLLLLQSPEESHANLLLLHTDTISHDSNVVCCAAGCWRVLMLQMLLQHNS
jgi:hypothetical protein